MRRTLPFFRLLYRIIWWAGVSSIVAVGLIVAVARLGLPVVSEYRQEVQDRLQQELGIRLSIAAVEAQWHGVYPELRVSGLQLLDEHGETNGLRLEQMRITLNLWASWRDGRLQPQDLELSGIHLSVDRDRAGVLKVRGWRSAGDTDWNRVLDWVLQHRLIKLSDARVLFDDQGSGLRFVVDDAALYLLTIGNGHRLTASASLAPSPDAAPGTRLSARLSVAADLIDDTPFGSGEVYVAADQLEIDLKETGWLPRIVGSSFKLWAQRKDSQWRAMQGELRGLQLQPNQVADPLRLADSGFRADLAGQQWYIAAGPLIADRPQMEPGSRIWLEMQQPSGTMQLRVDQLSAQALAALLAENTRVPPGVRAALQGIDPRGELHDAHFQRPIAGGGDRFTTRFSKLHSLYWRGIPAVDGISGGAGFEFAGGDADPTVRVTVNATDGTIDMGPAFAAAWPVGQLQLDLQLRDTQKLWDIDLHRLLFENRDLSVEAKGEVKARHAGGAPYLDLVGVYYHGDGERMAPYVPLKGIPKAARDWLVHSVERGQITGGGLVFRGWADEFPFDRGQGKFETSFDVVDAVVNYADGWPRLEDVDAEVEFRQQRMAIFAVGGHILDSNMRQVAITLPGMKRPGRIVHLDGELDLEVSEVRDFILGSPLAERYTPFVESLDAEGEGALHIKLDLPLKHPENNRVSGALKMDGADLHWKQSGLLLKKVSGTLSFDSDGLHGKDIRVQVLGQAARLDVGSDPAKDSTAIKLSGALDQGFLKGLLGAGARHFRGRSRWHAEISLPQQPTGRLQPGVSFQSNLKGLAVNLPAPLNKPAATILPLRVDTRLGDGRNQRVRFRYGERFVGEVDLDLAKMVPLRGVLRFGSGEAAMPNGNQLLIQGRLKSLSVDDWLAALQVTGKGKGKDYTTDWLSLIQLAKLRIGRLDLFGQHFSGLSIKARHRQRQWRLFLNSDEVKGRVDVPDSYASPLTLDLERLHMRPPGGERGQRPPDPRELPPMAITVGDFRFDSLALGRLQLDTEKRPMGLKLRALSLQSPLLKVSAKGLWELRKGKQYSDCDIDFNAPSLGKMFQQLGFANTIKGGQTRGHIAAHWAGPPTNFALGRLNGSFDIDIGAGSLLQIDPGAGRLFGLLSLQAFTYKLGERYAELADKGFYFKDISGKYRLEGGNAYTESLHVNGPVARIDISGRIGLLARDYNQYVEVIPRVSSGLTLASGALAIGSPPLGAALLLAQTMFGEKLDTIGSRYYLISGSWDDPQVTRLKRPRR